jgi:hypothetical protein
METNNPMPLNGVPQRAQYAKTAPIWYCIRYRIREKGCGKEQVGLKFSHKLEKH